MGLLHVGDQEKCIVGSMVIAAFVQSEQGFFMISCTWTAVEAKEKAGVLNCSLVMEECIEEKDVCMCLCVCEGV